ncbi:MAG: transposase [Actinobacteria bacterium]|nr:transposase [Actinomycetota bacterium]
MARPLHVEEANTYVQHLNWTTRGREPFFSCEERALACLNALEKERRRIRLDVYGFVLMPDHFHIVIPPFRWPVGSVVQWLKLASAYWLRAEGLIPNSPWARGYWDRAIWDENQLRNALTYIHANPVKAELAESIDDYRFSSHGFYEDGRDTILKVTRP